MLFCRPDDTQQDGAQGPGSPMADLRPYPFGALVRRMFRELERNGSIFDLPVGRFAIEGAGPGIDTAVDLHGRRAGAPLGPAAGPQTQMAQNLVLSWLGGCRVMELKTVQVLDELDIPRPCIDVHTVGLNAEWSQELKLQESLEEYVKGAMLIRMLEAELPTRLGVDAASCGPVVYDMSVGYDLDGIRSDGVQRFLHGMRDAGGLVDRFRREIPASWRHLRDLDYPTELSDTLTLSTFHGCPPDEIEAIIDFLLREHRLHSIVKFNPMLLGRERARELLYDVLGYHELEVPDSAFDRDTTWPQAVEMMERLGDTADRLELGLGAKFSNTLIVRNTRGFLAPGEDEVYLSGEPLHVLAIQLVGRFRRRFGGRFPISFSAGIDRNNYPDAVALGLVPITVCTDLLRKGGYGRLRLYHAELRRRMEASGARDIEGWIRSAYGVGAEGSLEAAMLANTAHYVDAATLDPRYTRAATDDPPRKIGSHLELFDCITCDLCVPVCPNDANFTFGAGPATIPVVRAVRDGDRWRWRHDDTLELVERHQIANFADFCNDCGNCDIFCPEDGGPYIVKPRFFGSETAWREADLDGFHLERRDGEDRVLGRFDGVEYRLEARGSRRRYAGDGFVLDFDLDDPGAPPRGTGPEEVDVTYGHLMDYVRGAVLDDERVNYVNAANSEG